MKKNTSVQQSIISVQNVSKQFVIPHERISTLKGIFVNFWKSKTFESFYALKDVSFEIKRGECFGVVGRNGSGKSTLLKILAGVYTPDTGAVAIRGRISPFLELGIGFNPELSGRDNIYLNATVLGMSKKMIDEKFDSIVDFSEIRQFIDQKLKNYSSGMQVRLAFSVAIHANREVLLLDEVLAVGDANFQAKCFAEFARYKEMGKTVILVTHDISVVQKYCDRALLLRNGQIEKIDTADVVVQEYVRQNMSDEERRIADEQKREQERALREAERLAGEERLAEEARIAEEARAKEEEAREKIAHVTKVTFLDKEGKEKHVFETGELLQVEVTCMFNQPILDPIFGIIIRNEALNHVFALNTLYKKMKTGSIQPGPVAIRFAINNYFATGTYTVSPAVATVNRNNIDWQDNLGSFKIVNKEFDSFGIADFDTKITIKQ